MQNRCDRVGVVGGKLRINPVGHVQQFSGIRDIGYVSGSLLREYWETIDTFHLCALDFGIPIGPFHQPDHDLAIMPNGHVIERINDHSGAWAISLYDDAEAGPARECGFRQNLFDNIERKTKAVGFFGIDIQAHARRFRQ